MKLQIMQGMENRNVPLVEGTRSAGIKVIVPSLDVVVLLLSDEEVADDVHHTFDS